MKIGLTYKSLCNDNIYDDKCIMLVRIDTQDATYHINPDGKTKILPYQPHIHIYKEGYGDKYAYLLPYEFSKTDDDIV